MAEKFYDVPGAAEILGLKHETMRRWLRSGKLRAVRLGRDWRISERAINELARQSTNQTKDPHSDVALGKSPKRTTHPISENPLLAALALADELRPIIIEGTQGRGTWDAAKAMDELRAERNWELSGN